MFLTSLTIIFPNSPVAGAIDNGDSSGVESCGVIAIGLYGGPSPLDFEPAFLSILTYTPSEKLKLTLRTIERSPYKFTTKRLNELVTY